MQDETIEYYEGHNAFVVVKKRVYAYIFKNNGQIPEFSNEQDLKTLPTGFATYIQRIKMNGVLNKHGKFIDQGKDTSVMRVTKREKAIIEKLRSFNEVPIHSERCPKCKQHVPVKNLGAPDTPVYYCEQGHFVAKDNLSNANRQLHSLPKQL